MILINSITRQFNVPGSDLVFGVVADSDAERKFFQCPRYVGYDLDLAACFIRINYRNANGKEDFYLVDDVVIDGDNITFSWLLSPKVTEYRGQVKFVMCAVGPDLKLKWHTTQGTGQVLEGLEPDNSHVESQTADVVAQLISMVEVQTSAVEKVGAEQVASVRSAAETSRTAAVNEIETAGKNTRDSIPADYTALSAAVRKTAPGVVCSAEGEVITLNDASDNYLRGLRIFGKSTQDGTPTPENPVEIVSVENPTVSVNEQTVSVPMTLHGIPVTFGSNYTDANGQRWICDEIDFARGVYVQRVSNATNIPSFHGVNLNGSKRDWVSAYFTLTKRLDESILVSRELPAEHWYEIDKSGNISADVVLWYATTTAGIAMRRSVLGLDVDVNNDVVLSSIEAWVNEKKVSFRYILATPIETPLSETELAAYRALHTNKPNTTIINDSGAYMSVDYTADTKLYIDNKIKEALLC